MGTSIPFRPLISHLIRGKHLESLSCFRRRPRASHHSPLLWGRSPLSSSSFSFVPSMSSITSTNGEAGVSNATGTNPPPPTPTKTVRVLIKGRVQGVFYRNWTVENARGLSLKGWVRNRRNGSVEALFSGDPDSVNEMEQRCRRGPPDAIVTGFEVFPSNDDPGQGFESKPTA